MLIAMGSLLSQSEYRHSVTSCGSKASRGYVKRQLSTVYSSWSDMGNLLLCDKRCSMPIELKTDRLSDFQDLMLKHLKLLSNIGLSSSSVCIGTHQKCFQNESNWIDLEKSSNLHWMSEKPNSVTLNNKSWINCLKQHWFAKATDTFSLDSSSVKLNDLSFSNKIQKTSQEKEICTNTYEQFIIYNNSSIIHTQVCKNNLDCLSYSTKMLFSQFLPEYCMEIYNETDFKNLRKFPFLGNMYNSDQQIHIQPNPKTSNQETDNSKLNIYNVTSLATQHSSHKNNLEMDTCVNILSMKMSEKDARTKLPIKKYSFDLKFNSGISPTEVKSNHSAQQNKFTKDKQMMDISNSLKTVDGKEKMASKVDITCCSNDLGDTQSQTSRVQREKKKSRPSAKKRRRVKERNTVLVQSQDKTSSRLHPKVSNCRNHGLGISGNKSNDNETLNKTTKSSFSFMVDIKNCDTKSNWSSDKDDKSHLSLFISGAELDSSFSESDEDDTTVFEASFCEMFDSFGNGFSPFSIQMEVTNISSSASSNCDDIDYVIQQTIQEANMKWDQYYGNVFPTDKEYKKVQFAPDDALTAVNFVDVHERKGPWEQYALDRHRFQNRIQEVGRQIQHCFTVEHRDNIYKKYFT